VLLPALPAVSLHTTLTHKTHFICLALQYTAAQEDDSEEEDLEALLPQNVRKCHAATTQALDATEAELQAGGLPPAERVAILETRLRGILQCRDVEVAAVRDMDEHNYDVRVMDYARQLLAKHDVRVRSLQAEGRAARAEDQLTTTEARLLSEQGERDAQQDERMRLLAKQLTDEKAKTKFFCITCCGSKDPAARAREQRRPGASGWSMHNAIQQVQSAPQSAARTLRAVESSMHVPPPQAPFSNQQVQNAIQQVQSAPQSAARAIQNAPQDLYHNTDSMLRTVESSIHVPPPQAPFSNLQGQAR